MRNQQLNENLEMGDLKRLLKTELHIDEYKSKMGDDADVSVISFTISGKEPAIDLVSFIEKGYDWVLDADVSSGELTGGEYLVFVEIERTPALPDQIVELMSDLMNLSEQKLEDWTAQYYKNKTKVGIIADDIRRISVLTPGAYRKKYSVDQTNNELDQLKSAAGINVDTMAPDNEFTESIRRAAGLK